MKKKKYLVTGGTGFLGASIVKQLIKKGHEVRVLDNNFRGALRKLADVNNRYEFFEGDIRDTDFVTKAVTGIDSVIHLAFVNGTEFFYSIPYTVLDVGVKGTVNVLDACIKKGIKEFFFASSSEVYQTPPEGMIPTPENVRLIIPDPLNPRYSYAGGKLIGELLTINYGRKYFDRAVIFRPHNVYGPDMGWEHVIPEFLLRMNKLSKSNKKGVLKFPVQGTGQETRSFCYIDDFTNGLMKVIQKGKHLEIYNIGTDNEVTIETLVKEIADLVNRKVVTVSGELKAGGTPRRCPDITKIRRLGYKPSISLHHGLGLTMKWYFENENLKPKK